VENRINPPIPTGNGGIKKVEARIENPVESAPGRLNGSGPVAIIDIGSNSIRLVVYERLSRAATPLFNEKELCGLARGTGADGELRATAVQETLAAIRRFAAIASQLRVTTVRVLATAAVREAVNGPELIAQVEAITGANVAILTGSEEARLSALGIVSGFRNPDGVAGDLGGGSLEIVELSGRQVGEGETHPLGGIRRDEQCGGVPRKANRIAEKLLSNSKVLANGRDRNFYAIGGTWRALARLHMRQNGYPLSVMHHYVMERSEAVEFCRMVVGTDLSLLDSINTVSRARRALLPYGAAVLLQVINAMRPSLIVMSALGVREGLLFDMLDEDEQRRDPLIVACEEMSFLRSRSPRHVRELIPWTDMVFGAIGLDETDDENRLRQAGCLVSDLGWRAHPEYRGFQSMDRIANSSLIGLDHPGRAYLALTSLYRHEGLVDESLSPRIRELVSTRLMRRARALGVTLRVAHVIAAAMPDVINKVRVEARGDKLVLILPKDLEALGGARILRRFSQLAKMAAKQAAIVVE
jgi:exopolyphosphatase/guanosine-5'-triphosphate,3'-diphosphate pyrophosphatase